MTWVSVSGTAIAIFLVMAFIMADSLYTVETAPETNRNRILNGTNIHAKSSTGNNDGSTSGISVDLARRIYENLDGVEAVSYVTPWELTNDLNLRGEESVSATTRLVDENFWKIYDFRFIDGRPFDEAEVKANVKCVVLTRSMARRVFGEEMVAGRELEVNMVPYTVVGVVEDVSPLLTTTYAHAYQIFNKDYQRTMEDGNLYGNASVRLLAKRGVSPESVKRQVENRYRQINSELESEGWEIFYHGQPYDTKDMAVGIGGSNVTPDTDTSRKVRWAIYTILIILPAINLSSMTRGRLRHRVAEIGVRRAFGAKRGDIIVQLFGENLIITLAGGVIGLVAALIFMSLASTFLFSVGEGFNSSLEMLNALPDVKMLFRWSNFLYALGGCLILNILSASVPAWRASLVAPAVAITSR